MPGALGRRERLRLPALRCWPARAQAAWRSRPELELLLLRQELSVLRRTVKRPQLNQADRMILAALARRLPRRAWGGSLVRPETVLGWHRTRSAGVGCVRTS